MNHNIYNVVNKQIREKDNRDRLATKGTFKNKGLNEKGTNIFSSIYRIFDTPPQRFLSTSFSKKKNQN